MSAFHLKIATDNAAFDDEPYQEIVAILRTLADKFESFTQDIPAGQLLDTNGNVVGLWRMSL